MVLYRVMDVLFYVEKLFVWIKYVLLTIEGYNSTHQSRCPRYSGAVSRCPPGVMIAEWFGSSKLSLLSDHLPALRVIINLSVCSHFHWPFEFCFKKWTHRQTYLFCFMKWTHRQTYWDLFTLISNNQVVPLVY